LPEPSSPAGGRHRTNRYLNNRIEQNHRGINSRYQPMRGFKSSSSAAVFDELRNFLRSRSNRNQSVPANHRRLHVLSRALTAISILTAA
jgi:putative transposase